MTVSPTATLLALRARDERQPSVGQANGGRLQRSLARRDLAVGENVISLTPPCLSLLKHLIEVQGGAIK